MLISNLALNFKVIGKSLFLPEPHIYPVLAYIHQILHVTQSNTIKFAAKLAQLITTTLKPAFKPPTHLNTNKQLAATIKPANNVVLAIAFSTVMTTLMYKITNKSQLDIRRLSSVFLQVLAVTVNQILEKMVENCYQTGGKIANALKKCMVKVTMV